MAWNSSSSGTNSWNSICSSSDGNIMYSGTIDSVYKSTDRGVNWTAILTGITAVNQIICNKLGTHILVALPGGTKYSTNSGTSFNNSTFLGSVTRNIAMTNDSPNPRLFLTSISTSAAFYQSTNNIWSPLVLSSASPFK